MFWKVRDLRFSTFVPSSLDCFIKSWSQSRSRGRLNSLTRSKNVLLRRQFIHLNLKLIKSDSLSGKCQTLGSNLDASKVIDQEIPSEQISQPPFVTKEQKAFSHKFCYENERIKEIAVGRI